MAASTFPEYLEVQEVLDDGEACWLLSCGWEVLEACTLSRRSRGHHSKTTSYLMGLSRNACRDVAAISELLAD